MRTLATTLLFASLLALGTGCDTADLLDTRVTYTVEGHGAFAAVQAVQVRYTSAAGQDVTVPNVALPFTHETHLEPGRTATLHAQVQAPANQSGFRITIRADGQVLGTEAVEGTAGAEVITRTLSITRTVP